MKRRNRFERSSVVVMDGISMIPNESCFPELKSHVQIRLIYWTPFITCFLTFFDLRSFCSRTWSCYYNGKLELLTIKLAGWFTVEVTVMFSRHGKYIYGFKNSTHRTKVGNLEEECQACTCPLDLDSHENKPIRRLHLQSHLLNWATIEPTFGCWRLASDFPLSDSEASS